MEKLSFKVASADMFYVHFEQEPGTVKYLGEVRRIIIRYRNGSAVYGWERVGTQWPEQIYKRRIDAAKALMIS